MKDLIVYINGDPWKVKVIDDKPYVKKFGPDSEAILHPSKKTITFNQSHIHDINTILHEVNHAYFDYLFLSTTETISVNDFEEIMSEYISNNISKMLSTAFIIYYNFNKVKLQRRNLKQLFYKFINEPNSTSLVNFFNKVHMDIDNLGNKG